MEEKIIKKLEEMEFKENENKKDLWGKPGDGCFLNWDFRKSEKGRFYVVLSDDSFEPDKKSKMRPEYVSLRQIQEDKEIPSFEPAGEGKINLVIKDVSPSKAIEILKHLSDMIQ